VGYDLVVLPEHRRDDFLVDRSQADPPVLLVQLDHAISSDPSAEVAQLNLPRGR